MPSRVRYLRLPQTCGCIPRVLLVILLFVQFAPPAHAANMDMDPTTYRHTLQAAADDLRRDAGTAPDVAERLRAVEQIVLPDGTSVQPDLDAVLRELDAQPPEPGRAIARLEAILSLPDGKGDSQNGQDEHSALDGLQRVLARDEFQEEADTETLGGLFARLQTYLFEMIAEVLSPVFRLIAAVLRPLGPAAPFIGIALIAGLIAWVVRSFRRTMGRAVVQLRPGPSARPMSGEEARAEAERLAQSGSFRLAIRALYLAVLLRLDERGLIQFDRALTNREVLSTTSAHADRALAERLSPLVERFDRFWYGGAQPSAQDYDEFAQLARRAWEVS